MSENENLRDYILELEAEITKLKLTMELHAGDCCSLNNEVELFRGYWEDAEKQCDELYIKNKKLTEILVEYGSHLKGCVAEYSPARSCSCGFNDAMVEISDSENNNV